MLTFNGVSKTMLKSDAYNLKVRYNKGKATKEGTVISIGEIEFKSDGTAGAEGADWDRLLSNQRQTQLPYVLAFTNNRIYPEYLRTYAYSMAYDPEENAPMTTIEREILLDSGYISYEKIEVTVQGPECPSKLLASSLSIIPN